MGATYLEESLDGKLTAEQVRKKFDEMTSDASYRSGNEYSGDWNMCHGISVRPDKVFASHKEASEWLDGNCQKWENAIAVRYKASKTESVKQPTYLGKKMGEANVGAVDSYDLPKLAIAATSWESTHRVVVVADQLTEPQKAKTKELVNAYILAKETSGKATNALRDLTNKLNALNMEFTDYSGLRMARSKAVLASKAYESAKQRLIAYNEERKAKLTETKTVDLGEKWLIGGIAAE
jgi:hypothetical protein